MTNIKAVDVSEIEKLKTYSVEVAKDDLEKCVSLDDLRALLHRSPSVSAPTIPEGHQMNIDKEREDFEEFANEHKMPVLKVANAYSDDDTNYAWWVWQKARASMQDDVRKDAERNRMITAKIIVHVEKANKVFNEIGFLVSGKGAPSNCADIVQYQKRLIENAISRGLTEISICQLAIQEAIDKARE